MTLPSCPPKVDLWAIVGIAVCSRRRCAWPSLREYLRKAHLSRSYRSFLIISNTLLWRAATWRWVKTICRDTSSTCGTRWDRRIIYKWESIHTKSTHQYKVMTLGQAYSNDQPSFASKLKIRTWHSSILKSRNWTTFSACSARNHQAWHSWKNCLWGTKS